MTRPTFPMRLLASVLAFALLSPGRSAIAQSAAADGAAVEREAVLKVELLKGFTIEDIEVWVNGSHIADVASGQAREIRFTPAPDGKNTIYAMGTLRPIIKSGVTELVNAMLKPQFKGSVVEFIAYPGGVVRAAFELVEPKVTIEKTGARPVGKVDVTVMPEVYERVLSSDVVTTLPGTEVTYKRSRVIERSVSVTNSVSLQLEAGVDIKVFSAAVRGEIERQFNQAYKQIETVEQSIKIDGNIQPRVRLVWIERYRCGVARGVFGTSPTDIPFNFPLELELRPVRLADRAYVELATSMGGLLIELNEADAPVATRNFLDNVMTGQYDGTIFDQVVPDVAVAGGYYTRDFSPKAAAGTIEAEQTVGLFNRVGTIGMLPVQKGSSRSHFFINVTDNKHFDQPADGSRYPVFGRVIKGMEIVDAMKGVATQKNPKIGRDNTPVKTIEIIRARQLSAEEARARLTPLAEAPK